MVDRLPNNIFWRNKIISTKYFKSKNEHLLKYNVNPILNTPTAIQIEKFNRSENCINNPDYFFLMTGLDV